MTSINCPTSASASSNRVLSVSISSRTTARLVAELLLVPPPLPPKRTSDVAAPLFSIARSFFSSSRAYAFCSSIRHVFFFTASSSSSLKQSTIFLFSSNRTDFSFPLRRRFDISARSPPMSVLCFPVRAVSSLWSFVSVCVHFFSRLATSVRRRRFSRRISSPAVASRFCSDSFAFASFRSCCRSRSFSATSSFCRSSLSAANWSALSCSAKICSVFSSWSRALRCTDCSWVVNSSTCCSRSSSFFLRSSSDSWAASSDRVFNCVMRRR
mmetsp:Transcript_27775/g.70130  ORF Transcript_27775/g.70130 Transcript_27775/m.70130 type:complete len:269 (-) Transcript_27775:219-1025(-)